MPFEFLKNVQKVVVDSLRRDTTESESGSACEKAGKMHVLLTITYAGMEIEFFTSSQIAHLPPQARPNR